MKDSTEKMARALLDLDRASRAGKFDFQLVLGKFQCFVCHQTLNRVEDSYRILCDECLGVISAYVGKKDQESSERARSLLAVASVLAAQVPKLP
jgi:hypothetical protein